MKTEAVLSPGKRTILCIGAHPDDCELCCCGTIKKFSDLGDDIYLMSITDGSSGHYKYSQSKIRDIRKVEAQNSASIVNGKSLTLDVIDGELEPNIQNRIHLIRTIRNIKPDIIITNRLNDYHPDHRYTSQLVQDASYMLMVPNVAPDTPALRYVPVILYWADSFKKPIEFNPDIVINIDDTFSTKISMLMEHESQLFDWLPYIDGELDKVPKEEDLKARREWVINFYKNRTQPSYASLYRKELIERYGDKKGASIKECEPFEVCEYGKQLTKEQLELLFNGC